MTEVRAKLPTAVHVFLLRGDEVLLLLRCNTGYQDGKYSVIAGHLDGGEEVKAAAVREALEEAGVVVSPSDLDVVGVMHRWEGEERIDFFLTARRWSRRIRNVEPQKCEALDWFPVGNLPANVVPYVRRALENFRHGTWFDSFGWA